MKLVAALVLALVPLSSVALEPAFRSDRESAAAA